MKKNLIKKLIKQKNIFIISNKNINWFLINKNKLYRLIKKLPIYENNNL
jgi:hypothetical protein